MPRPSRLPRAGLSALRGDVWAALSGGGLAGQGVTAADARAAAKIASVKEVTQVTYFPVESGRPLELPPIYERVRAALLDPGNAWLVGGAVRDALLRRPIHDLDFAVTGDGLAIGRAVAKKLNAAFFPLDPARHTGRVIVEDNGERFFLDFATLRGPDLNTDLAERDFTVNAMALDPAGQLFDPMGGQADLTAKLVRQCSPTSLTDDPARGLRAVRLAAQLEFRLERATREAARAAAPLLSKVSAERARDELLKILGGRKPAAALRALEAIGLLTVLLPEFATLKGVTQSAPHVFDVREHTLQVVDHLEAVLGVLGRAHSVDAASEYALGYAAARVGRYRNQISDQLESELSVDRAARSLLFFAALMHDIAKPLTRAVEPDGRVRFIGHENHGAEITRRRAMALRLSSAEVERAAVIVRHHMRPVALAQNGVTARAIYRFFRDTGAAGVEVCLLTLADLLGTRGVELGREEWATRVDTVVTLLDGYYRQPEQVVRPPALITGDDVLALGVPPGRQVGELLEAAREAQAEGQIATRAEAMEFIKRWKP